MIKLKLDDLLYLLDTRAADYDEVVCFARDLEPPELGQHVVKAEDGKTTIGFAAGNCWRNVRVEEKFGTVVVSTMPKNSRNSGSSGKVVISAGNMGPLREALQRAAAYTFGESAETLAMALFGYPVAMLRKIDGDLHRNLVMEHLSFALVQDPCWQYYSGPYHDWVKKCLWADVPLVLDKQQRESMVHCFTDANFDQEVVQASLPVLVHFTAIWCGPCRALAPTFERAARTYTGRVKFGTVDTDECPATTDEYKIRAIPALLLLKNGKIFMQSVGLIGEAKLIGLIDENIDPPVETRVIGHVAVPPAESVVPFPLTPPAPSADVTPARVADILVELATDRGMTCELADAASRLGVDLDAARKRIMELANRVRKE